MSMDIEQAKLLLREMTELRGKLFSWLNALQPKKFGRKFNLDFSAEETRAEYFDIVSKYIEEKTGVLSEYTIKMILCSAHDAIASASMIPGDHKASALYYEGVKQEEFLVHQCGAELRNALNLLASGAYSAKSFFISNKFYDVFTSDIKSRLDSNIWNMPNFSILPKPKTRTANADPEVFLMRKPAYVPTVRKTADPATMEELKYAETLVKLHYQNFWHTMKGLIEHLGGHVVVCEQEGRLREMFVRDTVCFLHDGSLVVQAGSDYPDVTAAEINVARKEVLNVANTSKVHQLPFELAASNFVCWESNSGREVIFIAEREPAKLTKAMDYFNKFYPNKVIPLPLNGATSREVFHADQVMARLPDNSMLVCPNFIYGNYGSQIKGLLGDSYIEVDKETAEKGGVNLISIGRNLIMPHCSDNLRKTLEGRGMNVITPKDVGVPEGSFYYALGGPHCLTMQIPAENLKAEFLKNLSGRQQQ